MVLEGASARRWCADRYDGGQYCGRNRSIASAFCRSDLSSSAVGVVPAESATMSGMM